MKSDGDIDEISADTLALIQYLTPDEFFQKSTDLQTTSNLSHELPRRLFTADTKYHSEFLPKVAFEDGHAYAIKSPLGSGKTQLLKDFLEKNQEEIVANQTQVINIGTRNTLQKQFISEVNRELDPLIHKGFIHINDKDNIDIEKDPWISLCYDSLLKVESDKVDGAIIILDELISGWGHLYFAKTHISGQRYEIIQNFVKILKGAELIICLDANLADWATDHLSKLINKPITKIENTYQSNPKHPYQFLLGTSIDEHGKISKNDKRPMIKDIIRLATEIIKIKKQIKRTKNKDEIQKLRAHLPRMVIPTDSQAMAEKLDILLQSMGVNVYRLDRKTSGLKASQEFLANPNLFLETYQIDIFIYTPSGESGLNISIKDYFKYRFCFFFGVFDVNPVDSVTQMVKRVRDDLPTKIYANHKAINLSTQKQTSAANQLKKEFTREFALSLQTVLLDETLKSDLKIQLLQQYKDCQDIHYDFAMEMLHHSNIEKQDFRNAIINRYKALGVPVETYVEDDEGHSLNFVGKQMKSVRRNRNTKHSIDILNAPKPYYEDGKWQTDLEESNPLYWAGKDKASIYNRLPDIWLNPIWEHKFIDLIINECPWLIKTLNLEIKTRNPEQDLKAAKTIYKKIARGEFKNTWNLEDDIGVTAALRDIDIMKLIDSTSPWRINDELPQSILKASRRHPEFLGHWPKRFNKKTQEWKPISDQARLKQLLGKINYTLSAKREATGKREYLYQVRRPLPSYLAKDVQNLEQNQTWYNSCIGAINESLLLKLNLRADKGAELSWQPEPILSSNEVQGVSDQSITVGNDETTSNPYTETDTTRPKKAEYSKGKNEVLDGTQIHCVPNEKPEPVLGKTHLKQIEPLVKEARDLLVGIDYTIRDDVRTFEWMTKDYGTETIEAAIGHLEDLNQQLTLTQWLREIQTGLRLGSLVLFLGVEHVLAYFKNKYEAVLKIVGSSKEFIVDVRELKMTEMDSIRGNFQ